MFNTKQVVYVIPQNNTHSSKMNPNYNTTPESVVSNHNNKRLHSFSSSDNMGKRRRISPLSVNTVKNNYPVYVRQQPVIVTNYYKPQVNTHNKPADCKPQQKQSSKHSTIDISNQFKVTQVSEVFHGCSELSLPKFVIYLIYKIWCSCNISQYQAIETPVESNHGYASPKSNNSSQQSINYSYYSTPVNYARIPSPVTPSSSEGCFDKVNILYKNICESKIFKEPLSKSSDECVIAIDSDEEESSNKKVEVDPKDLETQILKACSRSCRGELKNNYSKLIDYVDHLLKITQISFSSVILALEYIYRLKEASQKPEGKFLNQWSYEEIIPIAFMMANKFVSDDRYSNTVWANVTNISLNHLNDLEMKGLVAISFRLYVSQSDYNNWIQLIKNVSHELTLKYKQIKEPQSPQKLQVPVVPYKLSPKLYTPVKNNAQTPSPLSRTDVYSPITPSKIQQTKNIATSNVYVAKNAVSQPKYHVINIIPQQSHSGPTNPQLIPNLPIPRTFKPQSQSTVITIPSNQHVSVPPFQRSTIIPKVQSASNPPVVFFPKLNNTQTKQQVQSNVVRQNVIYPSPPLSRTTSPNSNSFERYLIQNNKPINTIHPQFVKTNYKSTSIINPFIKGF